MSGVVVRIGFSAGRSLIGRAVRWLTKGEVSHSFFHVSDERGERAYEAVPRGFRSISWDRFQRHNRVLQLVEVEWPHEAVRDHLDRMIGTPYPTSRILWMAVLLLFRKHPGRHPIGNVMDCVESVVRVLGQFGTNVIAPLSPEDLRKQLPPR